jgi:glycosyltransferase involved in cell wall biosynthesis
MRGGEKVLDAICELYPEADVYTLVRVPGSVSPRIESHTIHTSLAQRLPAATKLYRLLLPLYPATVELWDLDAYDVIISSSHCAVKSIVRPGRTVHVSYCHSPMRYAWDQFGAYFGADQVGWAVNRLLRPVMARLARWDADTAARVDQFIANSGYVAGRIRRYYNRGSIIVYPPVDTAFFRPRPNATTTAQPHFLVVSALVPYKRLELAIEACRKVGTQLKIVGRGPERARLEAAARRAGAEVEFLGWRSDEEIRDLYHNATAVLLPGVEDFGMVPVEAQACGCPVVALAQGGACETVLPGITGLLVEEPAADAFARALDEVQSARFDRAAIRANAERFSRDRFMTGFSRAVDEAVAAAAS